MQRTNANDDDGEWQHGSSNDSVPSLFHVGDNTIGYYQKDVIGAAVGSRRRRSRRSKLQMMSCKWYFRTVINNQSTKNTLE